mgnify:CR=1 FL=1
MIDLGVCGYMYVLNVLNAYNHATPQHSNSPVHCWQGKPPAADTWRLTTQSAKSSKSSQITGLVNTKWSTLNQCFLHIVAVSELGMHTNHHYKIKHSCAVVCWISPWGPCLGTCLIWQMLYWAKDLYQTTASKTRLCHRNLSLFVSLAVWNMSVSNNRLEHVSQ